MSQAKALLQESLVLYQHLEDNLGIAHTLGQMLYFRPHNDFEELRNCYLVGGGTHPGSGIPTILESSRITSNLISRRWDVPFNPPPPFSEELFRQG